MREKRREGAFIPCGDSLEGMQEIQDDALENVSGGETAGRGLHSRLDMTVCPACGQKTYGMDAYGGSRCVNCKYSEN